MIPNDELPRTQAKMLEMLSDEKPHNRFELQKCLFDELTSVDAVRVHIATLRKLIRSQQYDISCERLSGESYYRLVRVSPAPAE